MVNLIESMDRAWYPDFKNNWDDWLFQERILAQLRPDAIMLDLGGGARVLPQMNFRSIARHVCGIDLDTGCDCALRRAPLAFLFP